MHILLSGFIAVVVATFITIFYHYLVERSNQRAQVFVNVTDYFDDLYGRLIDMRIDKHGAFGRWKRLFTDEEYLRNSREITKKLLSSATRAELTFVYGEGNELELFNQLWNEARKVCSIQRKANQATWEQAEAQIDHSFQHIIDPLRISLERRLLAGTRLHTIALEMLAGSIFNVSLLVHHPRRVTKQIIQRLKTAWLHSKEPP